MKLKVNRAHVVDSNDWMTVFVAGIYDAMPSRRCCIMAFPAGVNVTKEYINILTTVYIRLND